MSEEEKEAIEELKEEINKPVELPEDKFDTFILFNIKSAKIVLNYIDKLQKENEELKLDNSKLILGKFREVADKNSYIKDMYISKDKIRNKIKELEEEQEKPVIKTKTSALYHNNEQVIDVLNELLGE